MSNSKGFIAELLGTFTLTFIGAIAIVSGGSLVVVALAHGLALSIAVSATMHISGGQINPAVSLALVLAGKQGLGRAGLFIVAQLLGATLGGLGVFLLHNAPDPGNFGTPALAEGVGIGQGIAVEIIATFLLMFAIYGTAVSKKAPTGLGGFGIGLMVSALILAIGPTTGAAMNPARHFGTALFAGEFSTMWLYWVAPIIGAGLGALVLPRILDSEDNAQ